MCCPHGEDKLCGKIERVNAKSIRVLFDGESESRLIKRKPGYFTVIPGQEINVVRNPEETDNSSEEEDGSDEAYMSALEDPEPNEEEEEPIPSPAKPKKKKRKSVAKKKTTKRAAKPRKRKKKVGDDGLVPLPTLLPREYEGPEIAGKHKHLRGFASERFTVAGKGIMPADGRPLFASRIYFEDDHKLYGRFGTRAAMDLCSLAVITVDKSHPAFPPKGVDLVFWSAVVPVTNNDFSLWGGYLNGPITALCQHYYTPKKAISTTEYVFEVDYCDILTHETKLQRKYVADRGMIEKAEARCALFMFHKNKRRAALAREKGRQEQKLQQVRQSQRSTKGVHSARLGSEDGSPQKPPSPSATTTANLVHKAELARKDNEITGLKRQLGTARSKLDDSQAKLKEAIRVRDNYNRTIRRKGLREVPSAPITPVSPDTPVREAKLLLQYGRSKRLKETRLFVLQATVNIKAPVNVAGTIHANISQHQHHAPVQVPPPQPVHSAQPPPQPSYSYYQPPPQPQHPPALPMRSYWDGRQWRQH